MTNIIVPRRREDFFDQQGNPTLRFVKFLEKLTEQSNDASSSLDVAASPQGYSAQNQWLQRQISGLPEFTIDTTGFTVDTTLITTDKVIA